MDKINKSIYLLFFFCLSFTAIQAQVVTIPDANFKTALVNNSSINTNGDAEIQITEAQAFTGTINVTYKSISDLTGIEAFTAVTRLDCNNNQLTSLSFATNTALTHLYCHYNFLTTLDLSMNAALTVLHCEYNQLTTLDVSTTTLTQLVCSSNDLTTLDVSTNTALTELYCHDNSNSLRLLQ